MSAGSSQRLLEANLAPLAAKLRHLGLPGEEYAAVIAPALTGVKRFGARQDVRREGEWPANVSLLLDGQTCRYKLLSDGRRQITAVLAPGDSCDLQGVLLGRMDHAVQTLTPCAIAEIPAERVLAWGETHPALLQALWRTTLIDEAIAREWTVNLGRRSALERVAHLVCEIYARLNAVGRAEDGRFELAMTQTELADAVGLSAVHVNRTLQKLRGDGLITLGGKVLAIKDHPRLTQVAGFDPPCLGLDPERAAREAQDGLGVRS